MKKMLYGAAALSVMMFAPAVANATEGWYGKADVGYSFGGSVELSSPTGGANTLNNGPELEPDWVFDVGAGYAFSRGGRVEFEYTQRYNGLDTELPVNDGKVHAYSYMLNGYWDFNKSGSYQPYIGAGIGYTQLLLKASSVTGPFLNQVAHGQDGTFAYQGMAGVAIPMSEQVAFDLGVRFIGTDSAKILTTSYLPLPASVGRTKADYNQGAVTVGIRWQFAAPAPPPPPPPPPLPPPPPPPEAAPPPVQICPVNSFKVYFEWNSAALNPEATDSINQAVAAARNCNVSTVNVIGYTDTSGSPRYNQELSQRRASVVAQAMVASGIPSGIVTTDAKGESELDKQTRDGVREPLNRRSAVTISFR